MEYWLAWFHETNKGADVKEIAQAAQQLGYSGVALSDHVALPQEQTSRHPMLGIPYDPATPNIEPMTTAATMGAVTDTLRFMTYAYVMGMRDPFTVAKQSAALADLTGNRFALGITPGWNADEISLLGHNPATRGKRFVESIDVMKGLWANDLFSYQGTHYHFTDVGISPRPDNAPAVFVGGNSPIALKRAARNAGWIGMNYPNEDLKPIVDALDELSNGTAIKYVIAAEELSDAYVSSLEAMGITGVVVMPWPVGQIGPTGQDEKLSAMETTARHWLA